jgi:2-methylcitrate dehydratase PrpD
VPTDASTQRLADFIAATRHADLPAEVRARLTPLLIDYVRVAAVGRHAPWVGKLREGLRGSMGPPQASIFYEDTRTDPVRAAQINGVIAGSLEWDDTHVGAMLHPGVVVWPAALAIGQVTGARGAEVLAAVAAGYEAMIRIGLAVQPAHFRRGFQSTATCGVFGAAAAAARLLGLDAAGIRGALGIAASYAGGVTQFFLSGSEVKRLHAGRASASGVESALFAHAGLSGPPDILEGRQGFGNALAGAFDPGAIAEGLGTRFHMLRLQMKPHALSARVLAAVEAAEQLVREGVTPEEVERGEIGVPSVIVGRLTNNRPMDLQQAQMSSPFAVAMALTRAAERPPPLVLGMEDCEAAIGEPAIRHLSARIACAVDPEVEATSKTEHVSARVRLHLRGGAVREAFVHLPIGSPDRPMGVAELLGRLRSVTEGRIAPSRIEAWLAGLEDLDRPGWADRAMSLRDEAEGALR